MAGASIETRNVVRKILLDVTPILDEKQRRVLFGSAAEAMGHGGIAFVNEVTGSARNTITSGMNDIGKEHGDRVRVEGGGRKSKVEKNPLLLESVENLVRGSTYGNPMNPLCWTTLSLRKPGDIVNLENDLIGKYVETLIQPYSGKSSGITMEFLASHGF